LRKIIKNGPDLKDLEKVKEAMRLDLDKNLKENSFWLNKLETAIQYQLPFVDPKTEYAEIAAVTVEDIQALASLHLSGSYYRFVLKPENK
jgi:predicted Zn-dependent peptidase